MAWDTTSAIQGTNNTQAAASNLATNNGSTTAQNTYNAGQQALQGQTPGLYSQLLAGNVPASFTSPQAVIDNYNKQFNNWQAPQIAVNGGANSPMLAANKALGESNLLANLYNQGIGNYTNALNSANAAGLSPTGQTTTSNATANSVGTNNTNNQYTQNNNNQYAAIQNILDILQQLPAT